MALVKDLELTYPHGAMMVSVTCANLALISSICRPPVVVSRPSLNNLPHSRHESTDRIRNPSKASLHNGITYHQRWLFCLLQAILKSGSAMQCRYLGTWTTPIDVPIDDSRSGFPYITSAADWHSTAHFLIEPYRPARAWTLLGSHGVRLLSYLSIDCDRYIPKVHLNIRPEVLTKPIVDYPFPPVDRRRPTIQFPEMQSDIDTSPANNTRYTRPSHRVCLSVPSYSPTGTVSCKLITA